MSKDPIKKTPGEITAELLEAAHAAANEKCEVLSKKLKKNVYPLVYIRGKSNEIFTGFISEPSRAAKMEAFDVMSAKESLTLAGEIIINTSLLKEESHKAFSSLESEYDDVFMSGCIDAVGHVKVLINTLKKK